MVQKQMAMLYSSHGQKRRTCLLTFQPETETLKSKCDLVGNRPASPPIKALLFIGPVLACIARLCTSASDKYRPHPPVSQFPCPYGTTFGARGSISFMAGVGVFGLASTAGAMVLRRNEAVGDMGLAGSMNLPKLLALRAESGLFGELGSTTTTAPSAPSLPPPASAFEAALAGWSVWTESLLVWAAAEERLPMLPDLPKPIFSTRRPSLVGGKISSSSILPPALTRSNCSLARPWPCAAA
jgi:hypothetical protein